MFLHFLFKILFKYFTPFEVIQTKPDGSVSHKKKESSENSMDYDRKDYAVVKCYSDSELTTNSEFIKTTKLNLCFFKPFFFIISQALACLLRTLVKY